MGPFARLVLTTLLLAGPATALAALADLQVFDRTEQRYLTLHEHDGQRYVAGTPGHEYELRLRNDSGARLLAVTSVDGVNVVTGETAATAQSGYVLAPWENLSVEGWRKSLDQVAAFYFTRHRNSYAARTGRPFDVGVIGVALFREKQHCCRGFDKKDRDDSWLDERSENAPSAGDDARREQSDRAASAAPEAQARAKAEEKLGTGHGRREESSASWTQFERASDTPDEVLAIYYDSRENLIAQGVIPRDREYAWRGRPRPFPNGFVPDPWP